MAFGFKPVALVQKEIPGDADLVMFHAHRWLGLLLWS